MDLLETRFASYPSSSMSSTRELGSLRSRGVTAILGPTNTGKTHYAIERLVAHKSGIIGLPLRLLAREVYQRVVERVGVSKVALITGEEKIRPEGACYWVATVEAMPKDVMVDFIAIDEIQLCADLERGHVFTDRLLYQRGRYETVLIGSATIAPLITHLLPGVTIVSRPRLSQLAFSGSKKLVRLPRRTAIVAFSVEEVYSIAELIRRQNGGAAVVMGGLSPRTRNAQVDLYQSGEVDYLIATDAIGMGLNLDVAHVAFASSSKFDGTHSRALTPSELAQIAGRAGRATQDGTFGTTGRCPAFDAQTVEALENHIFEPVRYVQWRNPMLDFSSLDQLKASLAVGPQEKGLMRARQADDAMVLSVLSCHDAIKLLAQDQDSIKKLWDLCQLPDYRKTGPSHHSELVGQLFHFIMAKGRIPGDWFQNQMKRLDRIEGDLDTLSQRLAHIRTWSFVANRADWLHNPKHWQNVARTIEDKLSDALHEGLTSRFIDRRTSVLMRRLRENNMLEAEITIGGDVLVEQQNVGRLHGFQFVPDLQAGGTDAKTLRQAASHVLGLELESRAERFTATPDAQLVLSNDGIIRWTGDPVARLDAGDKLFEPKLRLLVDETLSSASQDAVRARLQAWLDMQVTRFLGSLRDLETTAELTGLARGIAFRVVEALGVLDRLKVLQDVRNLDQEGRAALRSKGIRFGGYHLFMPSLLKPAPRLLALQLWALQHGGLDQKGLDDVALLAGSGRTSLPIDPDISADLYRAAGYRVCGTRAVRVDMLERLVDLIRPAVAYQPGISMGDAPAGAAEGDFFTPTLPMTSLVGCAGEDFASILTSLGYVREKRLAPVVQASTGEPSQTSEPLQAAPETSLDASPKAETSEETSEVTASDASPAAETSTAETALSSEPTVTEPVYIDVWHLQKNAREPRPARPARPDYKRAFQVDSTGQENSTENVNGEQKSRFQKKRPQQTSYQKSDHQKSEGEGVKRDFTKKPFHKKPDHKKSDKQGFSSFKSEPKRDKAPDPNSPFAGLLALKEQLEAGKKR